MCIETRRTVSKLLWATVFAVAMAFVESAVVVYLRAIYYPEGFSFPLKLILDETLRVEVYRESATIVMLLSVSALCDRRFWARFAYFILLFGVWDLFYYLWLRVLINWPLSIFEWDILFLIPLPWIGPVLAPVSISVIMITSAILIIYLLHKGYTFRPAISSYILVMAGAAVVFYSFMLDTGATLRQQLPEPYRYELLIIGDILFTAALLITYFNTVRNRSPVKG